jgi:radical SAM protein with 4Fe4S-binding SPASM domain
MNTSGALEITTVIGCVNRCKYCPQKKLVYNYHLQAKQPKEMALADFETIISTVPKPVRIDFSGFSEPFLNPEGSRMIRAAADKGHPVALYTTMVGMTEKDVATIQGIAFDTLVIHRTASPELTDEWFKKKRDALAGAVDAKIKNLEDRVHSPVSRAGNLYPTVTAVEGPLHCGACGDHFNRNEVLPNGNVYLCCMDYGLKHRIGNLLKQSWDSLDRDSIRKMARADSSDLLCRSCENARRSNVSHQDGPVPTA